MRMTHGLPSPLLNSLYLFSNSAQRLIFSSN